MKCRLSYKLYIALGIRFKNNITYYSIYTEINSSSKRTINKENYTHNCSFHEAKGLGFCKCYFKNKVTLIFKSPLQKESQIFSSLYTANNQALGHITYPLTWDQKIIKVSIKYTNKTILPYQPLLDISFKIRNGYRTISTSILSYKMTALLFSLPPKAKSIHWLLEVIAFFNYNFFLKFKTNHIDKDKYSSSNFQQIKKPNSFKAKNFLL